MYCNSLGYIAEKKAVGLYCKMGVVGLELYCNTAIVLQAGRWLDCIAAWERNCIAEVQLYCNTVECRGFKTILQYSLVGSRCIAI